MLVLGQWPTLGSAETSAFVFVSSAQWVWAMGANGRWVKVPRVRNEYWVETGHIETDDPATDSQEG